MHKKPSGAQMTGIVIAIALLVFGVLLAAFLSTTRGNTRDAIVLPDVTMQPPTAAELPPSEDLFLQVGRENVQQILKMLTRPEAYYQSLQLTTAWADGSAGKTVEIWRSGNLTRAQIAEVGRKRHILSDGVFAWVWYDTDRTAAKFVLGESRTLEDLMGVAGYETAIGLDREEIADAGFVTLEDPASDCLYLKTAPDAAGYIRQYWVDVATQLLCKAESLQDDARVYLLRQTAFEQLSAEDAGLQSRFTLPDGKVLTAK